MQKKRVAIIGTTGLPAKYGGFETLAHHLVDRLNNQYEITVYCSSKYFAEKHKRPSHFNGAKLVYLPFNANGYQSIIYDIFSIFHALRNSDTLLLLGISGALILPFVKLFSKKPVLVNIDGQEWKRPKWNWLAKKILGFSERLAVKFADTVIADNRIIHEYVENAYGRSNAWLIEYGADHVSASPITEDAYQRYPFLSKPYAFNVCRIEPENNVHLLLEAFSRCPDKTLVVVGLWNHGTYGMELRQFYSKFTNLHLLDPIYNQQELNILRSNAQVYVHGHSAGGTNPSLVEAMYLSLPVMAFDISYNRETTSHQAKFFRTSDDLIKLLRETTQEELMKMSYQLKTVANERYTWKRISDLYAAAIDQKDPVYTNLLTKQLATQEEQIIRVNVERSQPQTT
ncbi:glycosyltransferase family 1 protein [soil metagenome]